MKEAKDIISSAYDHKGNREVNTVEVGLVSPTMAYEIVRTLKGFHVWPCTSEGPYFRLDKTFPTLAEAQAYAKKLVPPPEGYIYKNVSYDKS